MYFVERIDFVIICFIYRCAVWMHINIVALYWDKLFAVCFIKYDISPRVY
jgi:hypothetical protein